MFATCLGRAAAVAAFLALPAMGHAATITFDTLDAGPAQAVPLVQFTEAGRTFQLTFSGNSKGPAIFDTLCSVTPGVPCNGDTDLVPTTQGENGIEGNVLILQEIGSNTPDDATGTGSITLTLLSGADFFFTGASAIDDTTFTFGTNLDGLLGSISLSSNSETGIATFQSQRLSVGDSIIVGYGGSGGVDSLQISPVPVPAALPLLALALGGLGYVGRRRKAA